MTLMLLVDNSSDLALSTSLNDLEITALHIDGQSIDVDAPPDIIDVDIIDVVDEDDDIIDEEDLIPHDLADSDDEDLVNLDIDDGVNMSVDVARGHGGDGGGDDRPPPYQVPTDCGVKIRAPESPIWVAGERAGCIPAKRPGTSDVARGHDSDGGGKGTRKPNLGGRRAGRLHTRQETRNLRLKAITDKSGPIPIWFEVDDRETLMPLDDHAAHWANYLEELVRELPLHYPSWRQMPPEPKAGVVEKIRTQFDLRPHMESDRWSQIYVGIQQHLQKIYNGKNVALKERYWVPKEDGTYDLERIRRGRPSHISEVDWDAQLAFWNDPKNHARAAQNKQNRAKSKVVCRQGSPSIAALRDMHMETLTTREYPSLIHTFFLTHTVGGVFLNPKDKALYDEMLRLQARRCCPGLSPGKVSHSSFSVRFFPGDMSLGKPIPGDKSPGILRNYRRGKWQMICQQMSHGVTAVMVAAMIVPLHISDDRPPPYQVPTGCGGCLGNRCKGTRKPNLGGMRAGRLHTRQETRNLGLKAIKDKSCPVPIRFEVDDRETPCLSVTKRLIGPTTSESSLEHLQKIYNGKKATLKEKYWVPEEDGTYDLERIRRGRPSHISEVDWDAQLAFWNDPKNLARAAQNKQNLAKSNVVCRQGSRSIAALRDMHMETSATREYPSLIHTFFLTHTVDGVFLNPEDKALYDEMLRLQGLGSNTPTGVPYTEDEIMAIVRGGKQRGHILGVGRVLPGKGTIIPPPSQITHSADIARLKKSEKRLTKQVNMFMRLFRSGDKFSQMLSQLESQPEYGGGSGSGGCGDDEPGDDEGDGEDKEDEEDS
nr:hypothetical protein [Tanacetum cinerariifolium]